MSTPGAWRAHHRSRRAIEKAAADLRAWHAARCATCGHARSNVIHETERDDPAEGRDYYADVPFCEFREAAT